VLPSDPSPNVVHGVRRSPLLWSTRAPSRLAALRPARPQPRRGELRPSHVPCDRACAHIKALPSHSTVDEPCSTPPEFAPTRCTPALPHAPQLLPVTRSVASMSSTSHGTRWCGASACCASPSRCSGRTTTPASRASSSCSSPALQARVDGGD
jgi:hypothetical protein